MKTNTKKAFILAAVLGLSMPSIANSANCNIDNTGSDVEDSDTKECSSDGDGTDLDNAGPVTIQASAGVALTAQDDVGGAQIGVSSCHEDGSAAFYGTTDGGSVQKNDTFDDSCGSSLTYSTASSS